MALHANSAPWALNDFGIRVIVSTSFADIFYNNSFKNGILPIVLDKEQRDILMMAAQNGANARISVDLEAQTISAPDGQVFSFDLDPFKKEMFVRGGWMTLV